MIFRLLRFIGKLVCVNVKLFSIVLLFFIVFIKYLFMCFVKIFLMKCYFYIFIFWFCVMSISLIVQVFFIYEFDQYKDGELVFGLEVKIGVYVDINVILVLKFDKEVLVEEMLFFLGGNDSIIYQLEILELVLCS